MGTAAAQSTPMRCWRQKLEPDHPLKHVAGFDCLAGAIDPDVFADLGGRAVEMTVPSSNSMNIAPETISATISARRSTGSRASAISTVVRAGGGFPSRCEMVRLKR